MSFNPALPQPASSPAPAPEPAPLPFEPLRPQGSFNQDPAAQGFDQFAGQPQAQQQPQQPDLVEQMVAALRQQGAQPQPANYPQPAPPMMPPQAQPAPTYDPNLLNEPVVNERLRNLELTYGNAYQQSQDPTVRQAIMLAYHGERAQLEARVEQARVQMAQQQMAAQQAYQSQMLEPVFRIMAAQILARELGIQDVQRVLNDPTGKPITNPEEMRINAAYQAMAMTQGNIQQAGRAIAPIPTGGGASSNFGNFTRTASREDFLRAVDQAKRTGIRVSMSG